ncbi:MAG: response regulator [Alphaproteobacteria bacterium]|nr:response regulator [Alphaproteobacteria bacterium]
MPTPTPTPVAVKDARILVAEDNPAVREFIIRALTGAGMTLKAVADGQEALNELQAAAYDLLITDIVMPNVDGIALALKATRLHPNLKVVMISGYAQERMRAHNLEALVHKVIAKPFSIEEMVTAVKEALVKV